MLSRLACVIKAFLLLGVVIGVTCVLNFLCVKQRDFYLLQALIIPGWSYVVCDVVDRIFGDKR